MIARIFDAIVVNGLVNHPSIRPHVGGEGYLDLSQSIGDDRNHYLIGEHGGFALIWSAPGVYEIHTFIVPGGRGRWAAGARDDMFEYMGFAEKLWTRIEPKDRHTRLFAMRGGMKKVMTHTEDFGAGPVVYDIFVREKCR